MAGLSRLNLLAHQTLGPNWASWDGPISGDLSKNVTFNVHVYFGISRSTNARGIFSHGIQYRLDVCRGTGDNAQNFTRRGLLFQ